jgi:hypothetical protein
MATSAAATPAMAHAELAASINPSPDRLAGLLHDANREYEEALSKLDCQAGWIIEKMQRLQASIARSRQTDPSALSVNAIGELQGQGPELDRLCGTVCAKRQQARRLTEVLGVEPR